MFGTPACPSKACEEGISCNDLDESSEAAAVTDGRPCFERSDCCRGGIALRAFRVARRRMPPCDLGGSEGGDGESS